MSMHAALFRSAALALMLPALALAGPLTPPAGPVASTPGPEPRIAINAQNTPGDAAATFVITGAGSYYLPGNMNGSAGKVGIRVRASNVTIDLMGFNMKGAVGSGAAMDVDALDLTNITVRNGTIISWGTHAIDFATGSSCRFEDLTLTGNAGRGLLCGSSCVITRCIAASNTGIGIQVGTACVVTECVASQNQSIGISTGARSVVRGCSSVANVGNGFSVSTGSTIVNCTAAASSAANGIDAPAAASIIDCTASNNAVDGIVTGNDCLIRGNHCDSNGLAVPDGAGINTTGSDNRIEGNNCTDNDVGFEIAFSGNILVRNTCSGNAQNWSIVANNVLGPILDRTAPASAAVSGNSAPSSLGSTDANANYTY